MKRIIIIGASSGIGKEIAGLYARTNAKIALVGRREDKLRETAQSNPEKYTYKVCDVSDTEQTAECLATLASELGGIDVMVLSAGTGELNIPLDFHVEKETIQTNILGWTFIADWIFRYFKQQKHGHLVAISSVGGLRGDGIAPAYNASKAYQINYLEGLGKKAAKERLPIFITDIRPGFVNTSMAKGDGLFWVAPLEKAGKQIYKAIQKKKKVAYITRRWQFAALILKLIPRTVYCKV